MDSSRANRILRKWWVYWALLRSVKTMATLAVLVVALSILIVTGRQKSSAHANGCDFPAIFNFGDSNSDTGGKSAAFHRLPSPNGDTFFGKPSGRYCDGRVIIDFIAEKLGLPYLIAYLDSIGSNFRHGANFATGGSTIQPLDARLFTAGFSPISLDIQLLQFEEFKARTNEFYSEASSTHIKDRLPRPEDFSRALYTLDIGQNDLFVGLMTEMQVKSSLPKVIDHFSQAVEKLYQQGARAFWIHNTGPIGCLPLSLDYPPKSDNADQNSCINSYNKVAQEFNRQLKEVVSKLRLKFPDAMLTYVDIYSAKYSLISEATKHGFGNPLEYCCGQSGDYRVECWKKVSVNGSQVVVASCSNPSAYISWDSAHYSEAANQWLADQIIQGSFSDPPVPITEACK